jgi:hypothetical protein
MGCGLLVIGSFGNIGYWRQTPGCSCSYWQLLGYVGCRSARSAEREALLVISVAANSRSEPRTDIPGRPASGQQFASMGWWGRAPRRQIAAFYLIYQAEPLRSPLRSATLRTSFARAVSRRSPHRHPPCVFRSPALFSACSQHTGCPACVCDVCRPSALSSAIAHSGSSIIGLLSVFTFVSAVSRSGFVQFTGCSACGLGYPHPRSGGLPPCT